MPHPEQLPLVKFPYVSLLITGAHTEIVLHRGVGLHTVLGMTIDLAAGDCFDRASVMIKKYEHVLKEVEEQNEFIDKYNEKMKNAGKGPESMIPSDYFSFLNEHNL